ncbi:MAG: VCBS repeat-containing protein [Desulfosarcinaceae bacterium]|nr:VCBS repeat-containing protein [Desulfosarcinaceae bacterium]
MVIGVSATPFCWVDEVLMMGGRMEKRGVIWIFLVLMLACNGGGGGAPTAPDTQPDTGGALAPVCAVGNSIGAVQSPLLWTNLDTQTSWFAAPLVSDLDRDGTAELVAATYALSVYDANGNLLDSSAGNGGRIYAPHVLADLEGDGVVEIVVGQRHEVYAYEWRTGALHLKTGWPADTTRAGEAPEVRGLAAADLDGDGRIEVVATTTQTQPTSAGGAQVFVFTPRGELYQPTGRTDPAWPRYNNRSGEGGDADRNGAGHRGYGCYGLNVGIGDIDDDADLEILVTYDNHHIQAFDPDGVALNASSWFRNRHSDYENERLTWGQFIRWADPAVEQAHYHDHSGEWPHPSAAEWLQWTASPPMVVDLDGDGHNEVVGAPNVERNVPYETQAYALMVLMGGHDGGDWSARRMPGWEILPRGGPPIHVDGWYPPRGVPAAAVVTLRPSDAPQIVVSLNDGYMSTFTAEGDLLWRYDYTHGRRIMFASEPLVADLNQDGVPEVVFTTFGDPDLTDSGHLVILTADGTPLYELPLENPGYNGNGSGAPAAPTIADLDGDGQLEIFVQTFDHGLDIYTVPGSSGNCLLWPTARGGPLRTGNPRLG